MFKLIYFKCILPCNRCRMSLFTWLIITSVWLVYYKNTSVSVLIISSIQYNEDINSNNKQKMLHWDKREKLLKGILSFNNNIIQGISNISKRKTTCVLGNNVTADDMIFFIISILFFSFHFFFFVFFATTYPKVSSSFV